MFAFQVVTFFALPYFLIRQPYQRGSRIQRWSHVSTATSRQGNRQLAKVLHKMDGQARKNFAKRLSALRQLRYKTATEFAKLLGIEPQRYMKWEKGLAEPSFEWLLRLCQLLGCTPNFLLLGYNNSAPENITAKPPKPTQLKRHTRLRKNAEE
jgi:DNA-binding XRE family transcriptional regulator